MLSQRPVRAAEVIAGLWRATAAGRLPHALLFEGPEGVGKFLAARWLAQGLFCARGPGEPCGSCGPCRRFGAESHPDFHVVDPRAEGEEALKIQRIAARDEPEGLPSVEELLALRAGEGGRRVVLIRDFELATIPAQNALLKTLEEPRPGILLVLVCGQPERLLDTVLSRCMRVRFEPLDPAECRAVLEQTGVPAGEAALLARWARGSPGRATDLLAGGALEVGAALTALLAGRLDPLEAAGAVEAAEGRFRGDTPPARARARAGAALDLCVGLVRDLAAAEAGADPAGLPNGDWIEAEGPSLAAWGPDALEEALAGLLRARLDLHANLSPESALERALLGISRARGRAVPGVW